MTWKSPFPPLTSTEQTSKPHYSHFLPRGFECSPYNSKAGSPGHREEHTSKDNYCRMQCVITGLPDLDQNRTSNYLKVPNFIKSWPVSKEFTQSGKTLDYWGKKEDTKNFCNGTNSLEDLQILLIFIGPLLSPCLYHSI